MSRSDRSSESADVFAERLLQVIDEGRRTATYKLALLLALMDACAEEADVHGRAPETLHTRVVARHVLRLYLPQVRLYLGDDGDPLQLRQITNKQSAVLGAVIRLHVVAEQQGCRTIGEIAHRLPDEYERCLDEVERTFARYPLRLLQVVGHEPRPFLYDLDWGESVSLKSLHDDGGGIVRFRPGAGDHLLRLAPLLRPLIELHWARMVARINRINTGDEHLRDHLFGAERSTFPKPLRSGLADLQDGSCFYCGDRLVNRTQVDHFIPWSRWPNNAIENLVLADACNTHKRDYLPALPLVDRWARRMVVDRIELRAIAGRAKWESDPLRSLSLARSCYAHVPAGTPLWLAVDDFTDDDPGVISARLADLP
jgi:hypothetical protein